VTATSNRHPFAGFAAAALSLTSAAVLAACGSTSESSAAHPQAFAWLRPSPPPAAWRTSLLPDRSARLAFPPDWHRIQSDPGTVSAAARTWSDGIRGYLNATPQQGAETLDNWSSFRLDHNREEGDTHVRQVAAATDLEFHQGQGSCVIDDYRSSVGHRYREIACLVEGARATTVVVGAAPPPYWRGERAAIERAISTFQT